jgi:hypothetical protein
MHVFRLVEAQALPWRSELNGSFPIYQLQSLIWSWLAERKITSGIETRLKIIHAPVMATLFHGLQSHGGLAAVAP